MPTLKDVAALAGVSAATVSLYLNGKSAGRISQQKQKEIEEALNKAKQIKGMPTAIISKTIKGKGVSFMEDNVGWHGKAPNEEEYKMALKELGGEADE